MLLGVVPRRGQVVARVARVGAHKSRYSLTPQSVAKIVLATICVACQRLTGLYFVTQPRSLSSDDDHRSHTTSVQELKLTTTASHNTSSQHHPQKQALPHFHRPACTLAIAANPQQASVYGNDSSHLGTVDDLAGYGCVRGCSSRAWCQVSCLTVSERRPKLGKTSFLSHGCRKGVHLERMQR